MLCVCVKKNLVPSSPTRNQHSFSRFFKQWLQSNPWGYKYNRTSPEPFRHPFTILTLASQQGVLTAALHTSPHTAHSCWPPFSILQQTPCHKWSHSINVKHGVPTPGITPLSTGDETHIFLLGKYAPVRELTVRYVLLAASNMSRGEKWRRKGKRRKNERTMENMG